MHTLKLKTYLSYSDFLKDWKNENFQFTLQTSGSTGAPKTILLDRKKLEISAKQTLNALPQIDTAKALCALPTNKMGGFMQLVRAAIWKSDIIIVKPTLNPLKNLSQDVTFGNISISPMQLHEILKDNKSREMLKTIKFVLVGGAPISSIIKSELISYKEKNIFYTYGMTETYSHIALKQHNYPYFKPLKGIEIKLDSNGVLLICGEITNNQWLVTGDVCILHKNKEFEVLGRADNLINSGGIKFVAEELEQEIAHLINHHFYITGTSDGFLGQAVTIISENNTEPLDLDILNTVLVKKFGKYAKIKKEIKTKIDVDNNTGKIKRKKEWENIN